MRGTDGSRSLVPASWQDFGGYGDHLRYHENKASYILARGRIPSMVGLGQGLEELGGNDMGRIP